MQVAAAVKARETEEIVKPLELINIRFREGRSLSFVARRTLNLMIGAAGGDAYKEMQFSLSKADIQKGHKGSKGYVERIMTEIATTELEFSAAGSNGKKSGAVRTVPMLIDRTIDVDPSDEAVVKFTFHPLMREMLRSSEAYALLSCRVILGFQSGFSMAIYELGCRQINRNWTDVKLTTEELRAAVHVAPGKLANFTDLRRTALETARDEINQLAPFNFSWTEESRGRKIVGVTLKFRAKRPDEAIAADAEAERHSAGRKARRAGTVEAIIQPPPAVTPKAVKSASVPFPERAISYSEPWRALALKHGGGWDIEEIATAFRASPAASQKGERLIKAFTTFCEKWAENRRRT